MSDNKRKRGKSDRIRVSGGEAYEVGFIARKFRLNKVAVHAAIKKVGYMRAMVYTELRRVVARRKKQQRARL